ncbi:helix-turn-helix transcriptional regulator [Streptomyces polyrhachis]|uniref:Helix-turn-helix transcriptional regulator n=1 Tax=Streptomyces polyrhachis TaxID=1282885 RepID=A0ABW2GCE4_9ACTN
MGTDVPHPEHPHDVICPPGREIYALALSQNQVRRDAALAAPCLLEAGLLTVDGQNEDLLRPVPPSYGLELLVKRNERAYLEHAAGLVEDFRALVDTVHRVPSAELPLFTLSGVERINERLDSLSRQATDEVLTMQPGSQRPVEALASAASRTAGLLERGVPIRTLYVHSVRHSREVLDFQRRFAGPLLQVRTVNEVFGRMIIIDNEAALIALAHDNSTALEICHPPVIRFLRRTFDVLWEHGKPLGRPLAEGNRTDGVPAVQLRIARLMIAGNDDQEIALRLGINVRTVRGHIAKLSAALGSGSRAQLGFLLAGSGLLDEPTGPAARSPG